MEYVMPAGKASNKMGWRSGWGVEELLLAQFCISEKEAEKVRAVIVKLSFKVWKIHKEVWKIEGAVEIIIQEFIGSRECDNECSNNKIEGEGDLVRKEKTVHIKCT